MLRRAPIVGVCVGGCCMYVWRACVCAHVWQRACACVGNHRARVGPEVWPAACHTLTTSRFLRVSFCYYNVSLFHGFDNVETAPRGPRTPPRPPPPPPPPTNPPSSYPLPLNRLAGFDELRFHLDVHTAYDRRS